MSHQSDLHELFKGRVGTTAYQPIIGCDNRVRYFARPMQIETGIGGMTKFGGDCGGSFARTAGFAVSLMGAGTQTIGVVRCDQPRSLDLRARGAKKLETAPNHLVDEVLSKVSPLFE